MEMRKIVWNKKALRSFHLKAFWYEYNCSHQFVIAFQKNILSSVTSIANMPTIGRNIKEEGGKSWRFFGKHSAWCVFVSLLFLPIFVPS